MTLDRRTFLTSTAAAFLGTMLGFGTHKAAATNTRKRAATPPLSGVPDANGLILQEGFTSRIIATAGEPVGDTDVEYIPFPDGGGVVSRTGGGWRYLANSNVLTLSITGPGAGGSFAITFDDTGTIVDAEKILSDTFANSGGTVTPWGTWLSGEEDPLYDQGRVFEADPSGSKEAVPRLPLGAFSHAGIVCGDNGVVYLTQAHPAGLLYRFTPSSPGTVREGTLEACLVVNTNALWIPIADPSGQTARLIDQAAGATPFPNARLAWKDNTLYLSQSNGDVVALDTTTNTFTTIASGFTASDRPGDICVLDKIYVGNGLSIMSIDSDGTTTEVVRIEQPGHEASSIGGLAFDPSGTRLYFSSRRGPTTKTLGQVIPGLSLTEQGCGITYEVSGRFSNTAPVTTTPAPSTTDSAPDSTTESSLPDDTSPATSVDTTTAPEQPASSTEQTTPDETATGSGAGSSLRGPLIAVAAVAATGLAVSVSKFAKRKPRDAATEETVSGQADNSDTANDTTTEHQVPARDRQNGDLETSSNRQGTAAPAPATADQAAPGVSKHKVFELETVTDEMLASKRRLFELDDDASKLAVPARWQAGSEPEGTATAPADNQNDNRQGEPDERGKPS